MSRLTLFIKYFKNSRVNEYEKIIQEALVKDYEVISLRDYIEEKYNKNKKLLVLRHDVDHFSDGTKMMLHIEKKYGVKSSFYFRNSTFEPVLMKDIEAYGSESSLHFEPIADFVKVNGIQSREELISFKDWDKRCLHILKANLEKFRNLLDIPCVTIASHGEYENSLVNTANNYLTENVNVYAYLNIQLEAYNKEMINKVTCYISDVPMEMNNGYKYGITPLEAIEKEENFIMFLSHPNHWHYNKWKQFKKLVKVVLYGDKITKNSFKRI